MQRRRKNNLDGLSDCLPIESDGHKWGWLTLRAILPLVMSLALVAQATATPAYPLRPSPNGRYLVDANGAPFLIIGDAPHSILAKLTNSDAVTYLTDRGQRGFNALWIELLCDRYTFGYGNEGQANYGRDVNGNNPFNSTLSGGYYDLTKPNEAYWSHVDYIVQQAAANGLQCLFTPLDQGGWTQTSLTNGTSRCFQYGQFLGNRYRNSPNVIWNLGNDFQKWQIPANNAVILAIADGIRSVDNKLMTVQLNYLVSESHDDPNWIPRINTNGVYSYHPTYAETLNAYNRPTVMPVLFLEENYEDENWHGDQGTPRILRMQEYWSLTAGALAGHMAGSYWTDRFANGWQSHLDTQCVKELGYFKAFMTSVAWYKLVPDQTHSLLTAGYGTYRNTGTIGGNDYATAAKTPDGKLAVVYTPVSHTLTIALNNFSGPVTARWYDPTANTFVAIRDSPFLNSGSHNFVTPGNNRAGAPDWVLLLEAPTPAPTPSGGNLITAAKFNGGGHPDYLLYNPSTQQTGIMYLNNNVLIGAAFGPTLLAGRKVVAVADFNLDGHPDYLLFNPANNRTKIWYMNNNVHISGASGPTLLAGRKVVGVADFNLDGHPDYLLFNPATRRTAIWYMNNNVHVGAAFGPTLP